MRKGIAILLAVIVAVPSSIVLYQYIQSGVMVNSPIDFNSDAAVPQKVGDFMSYNQSSNASSNFTSIPDNIAIVIYSGANPNNETLLNIRSLERANVSVLYSVNESLDASQVQVIADLGFDGLLLNGNPAGYRSVNLRHLVQRIENGRGIVVANYSFKGTLSGEVNTFYLLSEPNYSSWANFINTRNAEGPGTSHLLVNIENFSNFYLRSALRSFFALGVKYYATNYGQNPDAQYSEMVSDLAHLFNSSGLLPSQWNLTGRQYAQFLVQNNTIFAFVASESPINSILGSYPRYECVQVIGLNLQYGYISFISQNVTLYVPYGDYGISSVLPDAHVQLLFANSTAIYATYITQELGGTSSSINVQTLGFNFSTGDLSYEANRTFTFNGSNDVFYYSYEPDSAYISVVYGQISPGMVHVAYIDASKETVRVAANITTSNSKYALSAWEFGSLTNNLYYAAIEFIDNSNGQNLNYRLFLQIPTGKVLLNKSFGGFTVHLSYGSNFEQQGSNVYYTIGNNSGGQDIMEVNTTTGAIVKSATVNLTSVSALLSYDGGFLGYNGSNAVYVNSDGRVSWSQPIPHPMNSSTFSPLLIGNNEALFGSSVAYEFPVNKSYSQSFDILNLTTGQIISSYFNNFSLNYTQYGALISDPHSVYSPLASTDGYVVYTSMYENDGVYVARV